MSRGKRKNKSPQLFPMSYRQAVGMDENPNYPFTQLLLDLEEPIVRFRGFIDEGLNEQVWGAIGLLSDCLSAIWFSLWEDYQKPCDQGEMQRWVSDSSFHNLFWSVADAAEVFDAWRRGAETKIEPLEVEKGLIAAEKEFRTALLRTKTLDFTPGPRRRLSPLAS